MGRSLGNSQTVKNHIGIHPQALITYLKPIINHNNPIHTPEKHQQIYKNRLILLPYFPPIDPVLRTGGDCGRNNGQHRTETSRIGSQMSGSQCLWNKTLSPCQRHASLVQSEHCQNDMTIGAPKRGL